MKIHDLAAYEILEERRIEDVESMGYVLRHKKSGARVAVLSNTDDNKVFYIGFRTPPENATGVPHIIEHTTLCGSEKFPVKDPFVELVKGSLNTFLNAMTYPDKTVYPIASYNQKDFENLMDVYLDAVFHPNIVKYKEIFMQEGWHYELESADAPLTINGVVYNEMKGAYSSPDEVLQTQIYESLFPDSTYSFSYGGDPKHIPELTYEEYLDFYHKYYHPSNAYIYLYGDMNVAERLDWMDRNYLNQYEVQEVDSAVPMQQGFDEVRQIHAEYPIASEESEENQTYLSYNMVVENALNKTLYQAFDILDYALVSAPGAPVRKALIDAGIGQDVYGSFDSGILQPVFSIVAKNANVSDRERFVQIIRETLQNVVEKGVDEQSLLAAINSSEFRFREADFGQFPKGLLYGLQCMDSWLYDDLHPFLHLECLEVYKQLKQEIGTGYFENLIKNYLLDNTHGSIVMVEPKKGLNTEEEEILSEKLASYKAGLSEEEIARLVEQTEHLKAYQEEPSPEEDMKKIPMLTRADMRREAAPFTNIEEQIGQIPVVRHEVASNGIDYITLLFEAGDVAKEDIPMMGMLRSILGYVDTKSYGYAELANAINIYTGGIAGSIGLYPEADNSEHLKVKFEIRIKVLEENLSEAFALVDEMINHSNFSDEKRISEILAQTKSRLQLSLSGSGHSVSAIRALSYASRYAYYQDAVHGIRYYQTVKECEAMMKTDPKAVIGRLRNLVGQIFAANRLMISFTASTPSYEKAVPILEKAIAKFPETSAVKEAPVITFEKRNEAFTDASQIQYVARSGNFIRHGFSYKGSLRILKMILGYDYLWINVRVKGGAYGCSNSFMRNGDSYFVSYRDPNLVKTNEIYEGIPAYLRSFSPDERDMTKYIIGTFGAMDTPLYPEGKGNRSMNAYLQGITIEEIQKERDEILAAQPQDIRELADLIQSILDDEQLCVIGNENAIHKEEKLFAHIQGLYE